MEVRQYLRVVRRWWWLTALAIVVTSSATFALTARQSFYYESEATLVVRPRSTDAADTVRAIDTLSRGDEINSTFAGIAESDLIKRRARETMVGGSANDGVTISARVLAGTNIIEIGAKGSNPQTVTDFAQAVVSETVAYTDNLNDVFTLQPLDLPKHPNQPAGPNKLASNAFGVVLGVVLGAVLAFLAEYFSGEGTITASFDIIDPETQAFNQRYFHFRSDEESARSSRDGRMFSVGLLKLAPEAGRPKHSTAELREFVRIVAPGLRRGDTLAYLGDDMFAILFPDTAEANAQACVADLCEQLGHKFSVTVAVCPYLGDEAQQDASLDDLMQSMGAP